MLFVTSAARKVQKGKRLVSVAYACRPNIVIFIPCQHGKHADATDLLHMWCREDVVALASVVAAAEIIKMQINKKLEWHKKYKGIPLLVWAQGMRTTEKKERWHRCSICNQLLFFFFFFFYRASVCISTTFNSRQARYLVRTAQLKRRNGHIEHEVSAELGSLPKLKHGHGISDRCALLRGNELPL